MWFSIVSFVYINAYTIQRLQVVVLFGMGSYKLAASDLRLGQLASPYLSWGGGEDEAEEEQHHHADQGL